MHNKETECNRLYSTHLKYVLLSSIIQQIDFLKFINYLRNWIPISLSLSMLAEVHMLNEWLTPTSQERSNVSSRKDFLFATIVLTWHPWEIRVRLSKMHLLALFLRFFLKIRIPCVSVCVLSVPGRLAVVLPSLTQPAHTPHLTEESKAVFMSQ